ncbi:OmpA family protein [Methylosinus sp. Sm6]|uniref:OmpA family protein n=1 Tax=Methylosinus sp. Sm6 TaxID=2866948 RepID=UPI001C999C63|nr:OmpA family protein [Methylosinus sp. Sm6]MBY6241551.1 OmpA family protein [Methylosinus sp. Sm6]
MSKSEPRLGRSAMLAAAILFSVQGLASAQDAAYFTRMLSAPATRGLTTEPSVTPEHIAEEQFVRGLGKRHADRSLSVSDVSKLDAIVATRRDVDFEVHFALNSADLRGKDREVVEQLGVALGGPAFKDSTFLIMGHTDSRGSAKANQKLSERRAEAVKKVLVAEYGVAPERLVTVGYGQTHLKNESEPTASENRRVQVVNIMAFKAAKN